jgi:sterol desaturase/sphingolipid hydroxylase (fatty acid hydroxylase superfamily)
LRASGRERDGRADPAAAAGQTGTKTRARTARPRFRRAFCCARTDLHRESVSMWRYWFDFALFPLIAIAVIVFDCRSLDWLAWCGFGVVLFSFVEYWTHRTLLHWVFWHSTHERHHRAPSEHVIFPLWHTPAIFAGFFLVMPYSIFAGFVLGYCWFLTLHHALHHWTLRGMTWLHRYAIWHNRHHSLTDCNYGITTPVWDFAFGTHQRS